VRVRAWESNAGFSMSAFTNTHRWLFTWNGFTPALLFFLLIFSSSLLRGPRRGEGRRIRMHARVSAWRVCECVCE
jgi:hypothetical protein